MSRVTHSQKGPKSTSQAGMTLAEVMVALLIFALIASSSVYALRLGVNSRDQLEEADAALKSIQLARILIKEDLAQTTARPARDEFGVQRTNIFEGGQASFGGRAEDDERILFSFVRGGRINPGALSPRSALQHVEYIYRGGEVIRRARAFVDETSNSETIERVVFAGLTDAYAEFLNGETRGELNWVEAWPVGATGVGPPRAVALVLEEGNAPSLRLLFWIGDLGDRSAGS